MAVGYGPLSGVTVVDLTQFLSGPLATMIMADLGDLREGFYFD